MRETIFTNIGKNVMFVYVCVFNVGFFIDDERTNNNADQQYNR